MATEINIQSLFPAIRNQQLAKSAEDILNSSYIGIDFGTSTTVVSIAKFDKETKTIKTS
jgi:hypothetical protein